jgi:hypothetical protein
VEVSQVRKRLTAAIERGRRDAQQRRERTSEAQRGYDSFLADIAVPISRTLASALKADGFPFTVATPGGGVRLTSDRARDDYIDIALDSTADPPQVIGHVSYTRGSRTITEERPVKPGALPSAISEEEFLEFLIAALEPWLAR